MQRYKIELKSKELFVALVVFTLLLTGFVMGFWRANSEQPSLAAADVSDIWSGDIASGFESGEGSEGSPYLISTGEQLALLANNVLLGNKWSGGKYFKLKNNIVLNDTMGWESWDGSVGGVKAWTPIGLGEPGNNKAFEGFFDGDGYEVRGVYINTTGGRQGLFGSVYGGTIKNVSVVESYINGGNGVGGIAGCIDNKSIITNSTADGSVRGKYNVGGIAGYVSESTITNVSSGGRISGGGYVGGIAGYVSESTITIASSSSKVSGGDYVGGIAGHIINKSKLSSSHNTGTVDGTVDSIEWGVFNTKVHTGGVVGSVRDESEVSGSTNMGDVKGSVYVGGVAGYLYSSSLSSSNNTGNISGNVYVGGVAGCADESTINSSHNTGDVEGIFSGDVVDSGCYIGGVAGLFCNLILSNSFNTGNISGYSYVGGVAGSVRFDSTIDSCYNIGTVEGVVKEDTTDSGRYIGGVLGFVYYNSTVNNSHNTGGVSGDGYVGGVAGYIKGNSVLNSSYNTGTVSAKFYVGGLAGYVEGSSVVNDSHNTGTVSGGNYVGGVAGAVYNSSTVENCYNTGMASAKSYVGGIAGYVYNQSRLTLSYNTGSVSCVTDTTGGYAAGVAGAVYNGSTVDSSYNTGDISGGSSSVCIGGVAGHVKDNSAVSNSYNTGDASGKLNVGGVVAHVYKSTVSNSYNTGSAGGEINVGGVVGWVAQSTLKNSYTIGTVSGVGQSDYVGGVAGNQTDSTIQNCYYNKDGFSADATGKTEGGATSNIAGLTMAEMLTTGSMTDLGSGFVRRATDNLYCYYPELAIFFDDSQATHSKKSVQIERREVTLISVHFVYGEALADSVPTACEQGTLVVVKGGTIVWQNPDRKLDAGIHTEAASFSHPSDLYKSATQQVEITVEPKVIGLIWSGYADLVYDGQRKNVTATATGVFEDDSVKVTVSGGDKINAGVYVATVVYLDNPNYVLPPNPTKTYEIKARVIELSWEDYTDLIYDGKEKNVTATPTNILSGDEVIIIVLGGNEVSAGNYVAIASELQGENAGNYILLSTGAAKNYSIAKAVYSGERPVVELEKTGRDSIIIKPIDGAEYSIDGGITWQDSNKFYNLKPNKNYKAAVRMKDTGSVSTSSMAVVDVEVKGLSTGEIVAIVAVGLIVLRVAFMVAGWFMRKRKESAK